MKLPISLLEEYINTKLTAEKIADVLQLSGTEVDSINYPDESLKKVVVGVITAIEKHPDANKLQIATVKVGLGKTLTIVCGANNIKVGQKVPVALPGTTLPGDFKIKKAKIRGVDSAGMICAEDELGLGDEHAGIMVLDEALKVGTPLRKALNCSEAVIDCDVTRNRVDLFSVEGLARDIAAATGKTVKTTKSKTSLPAPKTTHVKAKVSGKDLSPIYTAVYIENVKVGPSPQWLQTILRELGARPINNVVDITNYVLMKLGQPLHAFDADKLEKSGDAISIDVREAKKGEKLKALDGNEYSLTSKNIVIADNKGPIALAGVMGGEESSVTYKTKNIILETALFHTTRTRKSAKSLGLRTDSSTRFEKGLAKEGVERAAEYAVDLLKKYTDAKVVSKAEVKGKAQAELKNVLVTTKFLEDRIGVAIPSTEIKKILENLGCKVSEKEKITLSIEPPWWRRDITIPEDIVEEVVRIYDINNLPRTSIRSIIIPTEVDTYQRTLSLVRERMAGYGFNEIISYPYYSEEDRKSDSFSMFCDGRLDHITLSNPLRPEQKYLRKSILPFILKAVAKNIPLVHDESGVQLFETGKIYLSSRNNLPKEETLLVAATTFDKGSSQATALILKGIVEDTLKQFQLDTNKLKVSSVKGDEIVYEYNGKTLSVVQIISQTMLTRFKIKKPTAVFELSLTTLMTMREAPKKFTPLPQYPEVSRDLSVVVSEKTLWGDIEKAVHEKKEILEEVHFLNQFNLKDKTKSISFRMIFRSKEETLTAEDADKEVQGILSLLEKRFNATLRK